jgi:hypothetical protein
MKCLVTGRGTSGSWKIRGEQLGTAIGATVQPNAMKLHGFDLGIIVKRVSGELLHRTRTARLPVVYDVIDGWPQPTGNHEWSREDCLNWLGSRIREMAPVGIVTSTVIMREDCAKFKIPVLALPHHIRPNQVKNPIREQVQRVGYEGATQYLGRWREVFERECKKRGWEFVIEPSSLDELDIVVAVRDCKGYAAVNWKSNVKLANAQGSGTPCIVDREAAYVETATGGEVWVSEPHDVSSAFESLTTKEARQAASEKLQTGQLTLEHVAEEYKCWLQTLKR